MTTRGYQTRVARDGEEAVAVDEFRPDLMPLDVTTPNLDGYQIAHRLRSAGHADMKIVMLTAVGRNTEVATGLAVGADLYITKPFSTPYLVDQVARLLGG